MGATLAPDRILRELEAMWVTLANPGEGGTEAGVLRACSMTLIVLAEESENVADFGETVAALMPEHPARAILIRLRGGGERILADRVYAQCWMPFGQRRQICCEQVEITASDPALGDLASLLLPLAVPDLPVVLWCRSPRLVGMPEFRAIAAIAQKVIVDTTAFPDARAALRRLADAVARGVLLGDLAWTRITRWREMVGQVFENRERLAQLPRISRVRAGFSGNNEPLAWYMGAWVANALADAGVRAEFSVFADQTPSLRVLLEGEGFHAELVREQERMVVTINDFSTCTSLSQPTDYLLMREELSIVRPDPVFEKTLASAAQLAYASGK